MALIKTKITQQLGHNLWPDKKGIIWFSHDVDGPGYPYPDDPRVPGENILKAEAIIATGEKWAITKSGGAMPSSAKISSTVSGGTHLIQIILKENVEAEGVYTLTIGKAVSRVTIKVLGTPTISYNGPCVFYEGEENTITATVKGAVATDWENGPADQPNTTYSWIAGNGYVLFGQDDYDLLNGTKAGTIYARSYAKILGKKMHRGYVLGLQAANFTMYNTSMADDVMELGLFAKRMNATLKAKLSGVVSAEKPGIISIKFPEAFAGPNKFHIYFFCRKFEAGSNGDFGYYIKEVTIGSIAEGETVSFPLLGIDGQHIDYSSDYLGEDNDGEYTLSPQAYSFTGTAAVAIQHCGHKTAIDCGTVTSENKPKIGALYPATEVKIKAGQTVVFSAPLASGEPPLTITWHFSTDKGKTWPQVGQGYAAGFAPTASGLVAAKVSNKHGSDFSDNSVPLTVENVAPARRRTGLYIIGRVRTQRAGG